MRGMIHNLLNHRDLRGVFLQHMMDDYAHVVLCLEAMTPAIIIPPDMFDLRGLMEQAITHDCRRVVRAMWMYIPSIDKKLAQQTLQLDLVAIVKILIKYGCRIDHFDTRYAKSFAMLAVLEPHVHPMPISALFICYHIANERVIKWKEEDVIDALLLSADVKPVYLRYMCQNMITRSYSMRQIIRWVIQCHISNEDAMVHILQSDCWKPDYTVQEIYHYGTRRMVQAYVTKVLQQNRLAQEIDTLIQTPPVTTHDDVYDGLIYHPDVVHLHVYRRQFKNTTFVRALLRADPDRVTFYDFSKMDMMQCLPDDITMDDLRDIVSMLDKKKTKLKK